ncbi:MAG: hypothetical protein DYG83_08370 [Candidatus Brocadia sp. AMX2]|uniref:cytochrome c3 family protein n=1 Tax=Candidatus Brocadia sp. AMX2 TaxID=2293635 RepID=UPI000ED1E82E|nr:hypothetical protein [Candidatus Brocadia sp. AMX2]MBC6932439.1 hypothetical protein [Candidatus Brocadia sp.]MCK6468567.1 hypothetical protein [Candidatus Brocadia sinica]KAA0244851.1 MAG: hypothetical protein EDM70_05035 [Candidatus Brocadia sp. AMX2]MCE7866828.1 hypothetical protein [Candidatus Brocadia sp. AMX2]MCQ3917534.1 hypothetical protein [Candidatus Brocadia sp.]
MFLRLISSVCLLFALAQRLAIGDSSNYKTQKMPLWSSSDAVQITRNENGVKKCTGENHWNELKQSDYQGVTHSCIDRCHVNYLAYENPYQKRVFRHKIHSPGKGFECGLCHTNDAVGSKTHGKLIVQNKDCLTCHHRDKAAEDCWHCHEGIKEYMEGNIERFNTKVPDLMARDVSCTGCHELAPDGASFKPVRECCIECHDSSDSYGKIYDIWKKILHDECKQCEEKEMDITLANQHAIYYPDSFFVSRLMKATSHILARDIPKLHDAGEKSEVKSLQKKTYSPVDFHNRQELLQFIRANGMHNIILSQLLLQHIKTEQQRLRNDR